MLPLPCMLVCTFVYANRTRDRGCSKHPVFPAPSLSSGGQTKMQTSGDQRREIARLYPRHCERSEAIHCHLVYGKMDCFASLAMTAERLSAPLRLRRPQHAHDTAKHLVADGPEQQH